LRLINCPVRWGNLVILLQDLPKTNIINHETQKRPTGYPDS
jgi:hypothetical protein